MRQCQLKALEFLQRTHTIGVVCAARCRISAKQLMSEWSSGKQLKQGRYVIDKVLGSGGFGITYRAVDRRTEKPIALKTLNRRLQSRRDFEELQEKFVNEAVALASCRHPHIVKVYPQLFQEEGLWCMVMEYVEGQDLNSYLESRGKLVEAEALDIISKVGEALIFVHQQGFLHRDVKPQNILMRRQDCCPVLIDFGLAREFNPGKLESLTSAVTESFAPIEQYERRGSYGAWTDVYALAATLYVMLTLELPIPSRFRQQAPTAFVAPQRHNPAISDRVNEAITRGMALEPQMRPQSVRQWLSLLPLPSEETQVVGVATVYPTPISHPQETRAEPLPTIAPGGFTETLANGVVVEMMSIPSGRFLMGATAAEEGSSTSERPQHWVEIEEFYMSRFPITQQQWRVVSSFGQIQRRLRSNPAGFTGEARPVERISWYDAVEFCDRLSRYTGRRYRLPTEAEWEYAARAGTDSPFYFGTTISTAVANYRGTDLAIAGTVYRGNYGTGEAGIYREETTPVGSCSRPNRFGLQEMHGLVWEWCADPWHDNYEGAPPDGRVWEAGGDPERRVVRGGSWQDFPAFCRSAARNNFSPDYIGKTVGLRVVCDGRR